MNIVLLVPALAIVFFLMIPGIGAFLVRRRWRQLRRQFLESSGYERIQYHDQNIAATAEHDAVIGLRRMVGTVDAVEGENILWVSSEDVSAAVNMREQRAVLLSGMQEDLLRSGSTEVAVSPVMVPWSRLFTISQGTQVFIAGQAAAREGRVGFAGTSEQPLLVVLYEGDPGLVIFRGIWNCRQRNEYYNQLTPGSMTVGSVGLLLLAFSLLGTPGGRIWGLVALTGSFTPLLPLVPPGVAAYFLFRRMWRYARVLRSQRDLIDAAIYGCRIGKTTCREPQGSDEMSRLPRVASAIPHSQWLVAEPQPMDPSDPMAFPLLMPEDPDMRTARLERRAYLIETAAVMLFLLGQAANTYILFVLLSHAV